MKMTLKTYLHYEKNTWDTKERYFLCHVDISAGDPAKALVKEMDVEVDVPDDFDPRPAQIEMLKAKKKEVLAELGKRVAEIDERINRLLALENHAEQGR